jgi:hypothetical protein
MLTKEHSSGRQHRHTESKVPRNVSLLQHRVTDILKLMLRHHFSLKNKLVMLGETHNSSGKEHELRYTSHNVNTNMPILQQEPVTDTQNVPLTQYFNKSMWVSERCTCC